MPKTYTRLTEDERYQIYEGVTERRSHREIASLINKHHSAVSREVKRNRGLRGYRPKQAQDKAQERLRSEGYPMVCATTIYGYIQQDKASGGELYQYLRHRRPYKKRTGSPDARGQIIGRVSIVLPTMQN